MQDRTVRPNVLIFLASDLGYGDLGCYGSPRNRTPNLDRLAAEGVRFTDCHSNGCMCSPSRAALQTGRYQQRSGLEFVLNHHARNFPPMSADAYTYGHAFRAAGYATGFFGTYHTGYLPEQSPLKMGYDEFVGLCGGLDHHSHVTRWGEPNWWHGETRVDEPGYVSDLIANHALDFLERHRQGPFCLHVADFLVHFPWQGPRDNPDFQAGVTYDNPDAKYGSRSDRRMAYREMIEAMDANAGRLFARLDALGLAERTLVIFATDHGGHHLVANNTPLAGAKGSLLEGGHRIPAMARWPGRIPAGRLIRDPVMLMDLFPTFVDLCRLPVPAGHSFDGTSLLPLLLEGRPMPERTLFWRHGADRAARRGPWKWLADPLGERLYNLADDLAETRDRKNDEPERAAVLAHALARWETEIGPPPLSRGP
jgi:arylsulfatase A-like enzyme